MGLRETTRQVLDLVERTSGYPVLVTEDRSLKTLATVRMARGDAPAHAIAYNPVADTQPDYLIAYQCGFILRLFASREATLPPEASVDMSPRLQARWACHPARGPVASAEAQARGARRDLISPPSPRLRVAPFALRRCAP